MAMVRWATATKNRRILLGIGVVLAIPAIALAWWLGSPLFLNKTVDEEFPRSVNAVLPDGVTRAEAESTMEDAAAVDVDVADSMTDSMAEPSTVSLKVGQFMDEDRLHRGSGSATVYRLDDGEHVLRLEDLNVTNGPDLFVLLMQDPEGRDKDQGYVDLGRLKGNRGNQNYGIPASVNVSDHNAVMIYCRAFSVIFSIAELGEVQAA